MDIEVNREIDEFSSKFIADCAAEAERLSRRGSGASAGLGRVDRDRPGHHISKGEMLIRQSEVNKAQLYATPGNAPNLANVNRQFENWLSQRLSVPTQTAASITW